MKTHTVKLEIVVEIQTNDNVTTEQATEIVLFEHGCVSKLEPYLNNNFIDWDIESYEVK